MNEAQRRRAEKLQFDETAAGTANVESISSRRDPLNRQDWINAAKELLIQGGIENVRIGRLAESLNVTRGGFYWLFSSRDDLLDELLEDWKKTNTLPFERILNAEHKGVEELQALVDMWIQEEEYSPPYDSAVRDWARMSETTAEAVKEIDSRRIELMKSIFIDLGYPEEEAFIRARVMYFHQVGYYILGLGESREARIQALPLYLKVLSGLDFE
jgi:AcrR family transcriptional regulator